MNNYNNSNSMPSNQINKTPMYYEDHYNMNRNESLSSSQGISSSQQSG